MKLRSAFAAAAAALLCAGAAQAENYSFSFTSAGGDVNGQIETSSNSGSNQIIITLTGTYNGHALSLVAPGQAYASFGPNDNIFYPGQTGLDPDGITGGYVDKSGVGFTDGSTNYGIAFNGLAFDGPRSAYTFTTDTQATGTGPAQVSPDGALSIVDLGPTVSSAPEPGTWALMMLGVGMCGWMLGYRKRVVVDHKAKLAAIG